MRNCQNVLLFTFPNYINLLEQSLERKQHTQK